MTSPSQDQDLRTALERVSEAIGVIMHVTEVPKHKLPDAEFLRGVVFCARDYAKAASVSFDVVETTLRATPLRLDHDKGANLQEACDAVAKTYDAQMDAIRKYHVAYDAGAYVHNASADSQSAQEKHRAAIQNLVQIAREVGGAKAPASAVIRAVMAGSGAREEFARRRDKARAAMQEKSKRGEDFTPMYHALRGEADAYDQAISFVQPLTLQRNGTEASRGVGAGAEKDADYDLVAEWLDWNATRTGDVYLVDTASISVLRAFISEKIELALADAATPTPPLSPDSTGPYPPPLTSLKAMVAEKSAQARAAALTPSAPIADSVRESQDDEDEIVWPEPERTVIGKCVPLERLAQLEAYEAAALAAPVRDDGAREGLSEERRADLVSPRNHLESEGQIHDAAAIPRIRWRDDAESILTRLRDAGWMVGVHNDYRLSGEARTFWLLTHTSGRWIKGEGLTDAEALAEAEAMLAAFAQQEVA